jgi:hypothetical protein
MERQLGLLYVNVKVSWWALVRQAASCKLQAASCKLQAASCKLQVISFICGRESQYLDCNEYCPTHIYE